MDQDAQDMAVPAWDHLPDTLEFTGEFGTELIIFLPFVTWLSRQGYLRRRRIRSYRGMRSFYEPLDIAGFDEKPDGRAFVHVVDRPAWLPVRDEDNFDGRKMPSPFHADPDLRAVFRDMPLRLPELEEGLPLLVVHNKYNWEWKFGCPINYLTLASLEAIFARLRHTYRIVYIRHGKVPLDPSYCHDRNRMIGGFGDNEVLAAHPEVLDFDALFARFVAAGGPQDVNLFKNALYARCRHFISAQGGGAHHIACFSGSRVLVQHRTGVEHVWPYVGYYRWLATPPVQLAVAISEAELIGSLDLFEGATGPDGRPEPGSPAARCLAALSPEREAVRKLQPWYRMNKIPPPL